MRAVHPKTGKPIQIMRTEAQVTKTNRHLLWFSKGLSGPRFQRWSTLVSDYAALPACSEPDIVLINDEPTEEATLAWSAWVKSTTAATETLLIVSPPWMERLHLTANTSSLIATTELHQRYPFLPDLPADAPQEAWVAAIATLMRFHVLVTTAPLVASTTFKGRNDVIPATSTDSVVPPIYLIQQYFVPDKGARAQEIRKALDMNLASPYIDKVVLLNEKRHQLPHGSAKLEEVVIGHRLTYLDVFKYIRASVPKNALVVFSNSDIYMDQTLRLLYSLDMTRVFLSLLRYDVDTQGPPKLFGPRPDSQDTWIVRASSVDFEPTEADFGFSFGVSGCDNAINVSMLRNRFIVANPALSIKTYHLHASNIRTYQLADVVDKPLFLYVEPTGIQEYNPVKDLKDLASWSRNPMQSFDRTIRYVEKSTAETICSMMKRDTHYNYSITSPNTFNQGYEQHDNRLYKFEGTVFTMPVGVVCDFKNIYIGSHPVWFNEWSNVEMTVLTNTVHVPEMIAIHLPPPLATSAAKWFLHYLPQALQIRKRLNSKPDFVVSTHPDTQQALQLLQWPEQGQVSLVPYLADCQYVSETVYALTPNSFPDLPKEHVDLLRSMYQQTQEDDSYAKQPVAVLVAERDSSLLCSRDWCSTVQTNLFNRRDRAHWSVHIIDADMPTKSRLALLAKADLLIASSESEWEALDWCWMMKKGATVAEIMPDTKPRGDHIHLAGAAELNYVLLGVKREPILYQRQHAMEDIEKTLVQHLFREELTQVPKSALPTLVLPSGKALSGKHDHVGDTFREMVLLWEERGYCRVQRSEDTPYVWWNAIGDTLLYDRPQMHWLQPTSYKLAFFGNALPEKPTKRDNTWSFWGRSPKQIEAIVSSNKVLNNYEDRPIKSIFLGRIESGVQKTHRTQHDWSTAVEKFSMPTDSTGGPYKFTQEVYLDHLTQSKFGLCLRGYGPKCNREIELFATGVVPIVAPGVDMKNYRVPPKMGVHYFVANTPEEFTKIVETTSREKWIEMSVAGRAWWRRYASAEGLFRFTWGLINDAKMNLAALDMLEQAA
jgi:hypothetical protein